jgi:hypothetical protein
LNYYSHKKQIPKNNIQIPNNNPDVHRGQITKSEFPDIGWKTNFQKSKLKKSETKKEKHINKDGFLAKGRKTVLFWKLFFVKGKLIYICTPIPEKPGWRNW